MSKAYEIRDPIHGFIVLNDWERDIVDHPVFQRLRRIRQLGLTDMVYPGAMHTRFEHSLGVMHVATRMFDEIVQRRGDFLRNELNFDNMGISRDRVLVRLSALLHDVGHSPFSHAGEGLMATKDETGKPFKHEDYSAAAVAYLMADVIDSHPLSQNSNIKAQDIADFLNGSPNLRRSLLWRDLLSSQLDADRADYLLRDSHHAGVAYGNYDLNRLLVTLTVANDPETNSPKVLVEEGGIHAAEGLIVARFMMFTQVYFQHARRAYDHHCAGVIKHLLTKEQEQSGLEKKDAFPPPTSKQNIEEYLKWDDWRVLGAIGRGECNDDGHIIAERRHHRSVFETREVPTLEEIDLTEEVMNKLGDRLAFVDTAGSSWYKFYTDEISILMDNAQRESKVAPLSRLSSVVGGLKAVSKTRIYVPCEKKRESKLIVNQILEKRSSENDAAP